VLAFPFSRADFVAARDGRDEHSTVADFSRARRRRDRLDRRFDKAFSLPCPANDPSCGFRHRTRSEFPYVALSYLHVKEHRDCDIAN